MYTFKSSPLIPHNNNRPKRTKKRQSATKESQYKIVNPFRSGEQQNLLPHQLIQQIQGMEYISSTLVTKINLPNSIQTQRRSSNFARHLHMMQNAARKQEQKFYGLIVPQNKKMKQIPQPEPQSTMINQMQPPMSIQQLDRLSIDMQNCLNEMNYREMENQDFSLFDERYDERQKQVQKNNVYFYSQSYIPSQPGNTDFDCYLNH